MTASLINLPTELLLQILSQISLAPDLVSCALASRRLFRLLHPALTESFSIAKTISWTQTPDVNSGAFDDNPHLHSYLLWFIHKPALTSFLRHLTITFHDNARENGYPLTSTQTVSPHLWDQLAGMLDPQICWDMVTSDLGGHTIWLVKFLLARGTELRTLELANTLAHVSALAPFIFAATPTAAPHQRLPDDVLYLQNLRKLTLSFNRTHHGKLRKFVDTVWPWLFLPSVERVTVEGCHDIDPHDGWTNHDPMEQFWEDVAFLTVPVPTEVTGKSNVKELVITSSLVHANVLQHTLSFTPHLTKLIIDFSKPYDPVGWRKMCKHDIYLSPLLDSALRSVMHSLEELTFTFHELLPFGSPQMDDAEIYPTGFRLVSLCELWKLRKLCAEPRFIIGCCSPDAPVKSAPSLAQCLPPNLVELVILGVVMTPLGPKQGYGMGFVQIGGHLEDLLQKGLGPRALQTVLVVESEFDDEKEDEQVEMWAIQRLNKDRLKSLAGTAGIDMAFSKPKELII